MIAYVLIFNIAYEANIVKGVFSNKEQAEAIAKKFNDEYIKKDITHSYEYSVEAWEMDKLDE